MQGTWDSCVWVEMAATRVIKVEAGAGEKKLVDAV
jgi:hypothetical protein